MLDQSYSERGLLRFSRKTDFPRYKLRPGDPKAIARSVAQQIEQGNFAPQPFARRPKAGVQIYSTDDYANVLVLREIDDSLRRLYNVRQSNRTTVVRQVAMLLAESTPKTVIKIDVKSFYESVDRDGLIRSLNQHHLLSHRSRALLHELFTKAFPGLGNGLPRGLSLSALLSELAMRDFDARVKTMEDVYFFARYVDDIVVFTTGDPYKLRADIEASLPPGMRFNTRKSATLYKVADCRCSIRCRCSGHCACQNRCVCSTAIDHRHVMDYLGYRFTFPSVIKRPYDAKQPVEISIAVRKMRKIKTRIIKACLDFASNRDFQLLRDRIGFLTGNYFVRTSNANRPIKAGIYYNYRLIEESGGTAPLLELNAFLKRAIYSKSGPFGAALQQYLTPAQRDELANLSFTSGFICRRRLKLSGPRMHKLKECWGYE